MEGKKQYKTYKKATAKTEKAPAYKPKRGKLAPLMTEEEKSTAKGKVKCIDLAQQKSVNTVRWMREE